MGSWTRRLSKRFPDAEITGIDISAERLAIARNRMGHRPNVKMIRMNGEALEFEDGSFDFVYSSHALEQMESVIDQALAEIARVARGRVVLIEPVYELAGLAQRLYSRKQGYVRSLLRAIRKTDLTVVEMFVRGVQLNPLNQSTVIVLQKK